MFLKKLNNFFIFKKIFHFRIFPLTPPEHRCFLIFFFFKLIFKTLACIMYINFQRVLNITMSRLCPISGLRRDQVYTKELSLCHKLRFSNLYIFGTKCCRPQIFQTYLIQQNSYFETRSKNSVEKIQRLENLSLWRRLNSFILYM